MKKLYTLKVNYFSSGRECICYEWYKSEELYEYSHKIVHLDYLDSE